MTIERFTQEMIIPFFMLLAVFEEARDQSILAKVAIIILFAIFYMFFYIYKHRNRWQRSNK